jgi:hypothetical protein
MNQAGAPSPRLYGSVVWTGTELIVWGGQHHQGNDIVPALDGARFNPSTNTWTPMSQVNAPLPRSFATAVWTGNKLILWGENSIPASHNDGAMYDPSVDQWTPMSSIGAPIARGDYAEVWPGHELIVWGGTVLKAVQGRQPEYPVLSDCGRFDPSSKYLETDFSSERARRSRKGLGSLDRNRDARVGRVRQTVSLFTMALAMTLQLIPGRRFQPLAHHSLTSTLYRS